MARNHSFRFKQFTIWQDRCAMKVCTDACAFGAWMDLSERERVLDIGTGTALLAMMCAQRYTQLHIDALEIDPDAAKQALENVTASPFYERIDILSADIRAYSPEVRYDALISNPPFFQNDLRGPDQQINRAHHAVTMNLEDLVAAANRLLKPGGTWHVVLPVEESTILEQIAGREGWFIYRQLLLQHDPSKVPFRRFASFGRLPCPTINESVSIYDAVSGTYTEPFKALLKDFYLAF